MFYSLLGYIANVIIRSHCQIDFLYCVFYRYGVLAVKIDKRTLHSWEKEARNQVASTTQCDLHYNTYGYIWIDRKSCHSVAHCNKKVSLDGAIYPKHQLDSCTPPLSQVISHRLVVAYLANVIIFFYPALSTIKCIDPFCIIMKY